MYYSWYMQDSTIWTKRKISKVVTLLSAVYKLFKNSFSKTWSLYNTCSSQLINNLIRGRKKSLFTVIGNIKRLNTKPCLICYTHPHKNVQIKNTTQCLTCVWVNSWRTFLRWSVIALTRSLLVPSSFCSCTISRCFLEIWKKKKE